MMAITRTFSQSHTYGSQRPIVPIRIHRPTGPPSTVRAILDTGAYVSVFDHGILPTIGITDVTTGTPVRLVAANGLEAPGYQHALKIEFLGRPLTIPVAFCPSWPKGLPNLLGMEGFFEQLVIAFEHRFRRISVL
jgi:hypothetical protein